MAIEAIPSQHIQHQKMRESDDYSSRVCTQLEMECCVDEIMKELGADINGRISYSDFVKRRSQLLDVKYNSDTSEECDSLSETKKPLLSEDYCQTYSFETNSNLSSAEEPAFATLPSHSSVYCEENKPIWDQRGVRVHENESSGHESWEYDSGTHDLEIDIISLHKQIEASGIEMPSNVNELLDLANRYYIESINAIKQDKRQIYDKLKSILREHDFLQKQITCLKEEKILIIKDLEKKKLKERKEYECKITELQSIIGELSHDLNYYQFLTIKEEEDDDSNDTHLENNMEINCQKSILNSNTNLKMEIKCNENEKLSENDWILFEKENTDEMTAGDDRHSNALQIDRLESRITHLETQIDLSALHLNQSKESTERLSVLLGKYESNNTALVLALNYSDKALEINELLVALLKTEIGLVLANCRAAGVGQTGNTSEEEEREEVMRIYEMANHRRKVAEELALDYLTKYCPEFDMKTNNTVVKNSITRIEPFIIDSDKDIEYMNESEKCCLNSVMDVEDMVALQDLVSIKEMNANLRSQIYTLQNENSDLVEEVIQFKTICEKNKMSKHDNENKTKQLDENKINHESMEKLTKANGNLMKELERIKKKYTIKTKKLEQKMASISHRNSAHIKILQNKISLLENEGSVRKCIETTI
ncbi:unnamed protein product [Medioppia subpectinata]|uniref:Harmonin-binding protein USHBP1 PDZ-binding domain-containing protein n=1 Tax=Medioppia subpectinata TaxID=1979941 RepID=A0A7R9PU27_9ACAR|nr:unnamed protein product [Medioppia subpectinata]CAG2101084.1 unnamed protein product [Medioppia subpectinata]